MKSLLLVGVVAADNSYRVVSWNVAGILGNRYEFHADDNKDFIKKVEFELKIIGAGKRPVDKDIFYKGMKCEDGVMPLNKLFLKDAWKNEIEREKQKKMKNSELPENEKVQYFFEQIGAADKQIKRLTYDKECPEDITTIIQYKDKWVKDYKEAVNDKKFTSQLTRKDNELKELQPDDEKVKKYICKSLVNLYVRDVFLFETRLKFLNPNKLGNTNNKILAPWPSEKTMKDKLKQLSKNYGDKTDIFALQEVNPIFLKEVMVTHFEGFKMFVHPKIQEAIDKCLSETKEAAIKECKEANNDVSALLLDMGIFATVKVFGGMVDTSNTKEPQKEVVVNAKGQGENKSVIIASFHANSNGKDTEPFIKNLKELVGYLEIVLGLDANTVNQTVDAGNPLFSEFEAEAKKLGYTVGSIDQKETSRKIRTILQLQIGKGYTLEQSNEIQADRKDHVLFDEGNKGRKCLVDNTFNFKYESRNLPDDRFLSDHAIVYCGPLDVIKKQRAQKKWKQLSKNLTKVKTLLIKERSG